VKKSLARLAPLLLLIGALALPAPAYATSVNVAGRPIQGNINTGHAGSCSGIGYGRVNGSLVVFLADHCRTGHSENEPGDPVMGPTGVVIGTWASIIPAIQQHDLSYFWVNAAGTPGNANRIYRGDVAGSDFWEMTAQPSSALSCDGEAEWGSDDIYQMNQISSETTEPYRTGSLPAEALSDLYTYYSYVTYSDGSTHCRIYTYDLPVRYAPNLHIESSSPIMKEAQSARLFAYATGMSNGCGGDCITITPIYNSLKAADDYWEVNGSNLGAYMCIDAACTPQP
jgi:hypothetical protein